VTVQAAVEKALSCVANHPVNVICAGRTDSGVHATAQTIHFDSDAERPDHSWMLGANVHLPGDIKILWANKVDNRFHARFSAQARQYRYIILNRPVASAIAFKRVTWERRPLDVERMQKGALHLLGTHDFTSYRAVSCQANSAVRNVQYLQVTQQNDFLYLDIKANAFLHHMVRNIAGVLMTVGQHEQEPGWVREVLDVRDRTQAGVTAPAHGLYLVGVSYPSEFSISSQGYLPVF
jgi:tRNA pseudouridine38-40 synthase